MVKSQGKNKLIVAIVVLVVLLLVVGGIYARAVSQNNSETSKDTTQSAESSADTPSTDTEMTDQETVTPEVSPVDPETLDSIAVEPLGVNVFYTKGTPGFDFQVKRAADGTQYADFSSTDLVGTKCTDDQGVFVSIVKNPASGEDTLISETMKLGKDTYGLTMSGAGCTNNADLLSQYQSGFKNGFSSLTSL